ncbi:sulfurtransferase TusA family protein [Melghirimyces algeriensis]|uniref:TusA-related sulfurtransferase n=1 Tax=Melghirimyces algeriensis TaxID=910412 RepID=A0A521F3V1_9BACL|nr:sulfurtransferase TusA family protein [Melghirimyces algeriensis]SMO90200.1 TusA-related sulfurtransferase [Melghirimyces algeriensis]
MNQNKKLRVDARGAFCPGPLMELMRAAKDAEPGTEIELLTNDAGSRKDVPLWAEKMGHKYLGEQLEGNVYTLTVQIGGN